ncbi:MAG: hypothetical protein LBB80_00020 [Treponema sp.]|jgi:hypothetical protein|nr:hypothetical protein [Treponema sp.]
MNFLDLILDLTHNHSKKWKEDFGEDDYTKLVDSFVDNFGSMKNRVDAYFNTKEIEDKLKNTK